jgi:hypothetical protein
MRRGCLLLYAGTRQYPTPRPPLLEVGEERVPFPVGRGAVFRAGPIAQVGGVLVEDAGLLPGPAVDQQFLRAGSTGEAADGIAGQAYFLGDLGLAAALEQRRSCSSTFTEGTRQLTRH